MMLILLYACRRKHASKHDQKHNATEVLWRSLANDKKTDYCSALIKGIMRDTEFLILDAIVFT